MRYSSVEWTAVLPRNPRRRFGFLVCIKWRLPALLRRTLPPAVILKRLAADFLVLMPFGRRIVNPLSLKKSAQYRLDANREARGIFGAKSGNRKSEKSGNDGTRAAFPARSAAMSKSDGALAPKGACPEICYQDLMLSAWAASLGTGFWICDCGPQREFAGLLGAEKRKSEKREIGKRRHACQVPCSDVKER